SGSKNIFTSRFTTSLATRSGRTRPNISTNSRTRSGRPSLYGRYIIGRESPQAANEKAPLKGVSAACAAPACTAAGQTGSAAVPVSSPRRSRRGEFAFCVIGGLPLNASSQALAAIGDAASLQAARPGLQLGWP